MLEILVSIGCALSILYTYPVDITLGGPSIRAIPHLLCLRTYSDSIANLLDAHVSECRLVHVHEVLPVDVVFYDK